MNSPIWYLSAMLIILPLFFLILVKFQDNTVGVICFLSPLLIYGYFSRTAGHLDQWSSWTGLFHVSLIRVWAGLCIGWAVFYLSKWISTINFTPSGEALLSLFELSTIGIVFISMYTRTHRRLDFLCVGLLAVAVSIAFSEKASIHKCFSAGWSSVAEYSLALYVTHWTVRMLLPAMIPTAAYGEMLLPYFILSSLYAALTMTLIKVIQKHFLWEWIKKQIVFPAQKWGSKNDTEI